MKLDEIILGQDYAVSELGKALLSNPDRPHSFPPSFPFDYHTRVTVLSVREPFKARRDGVRVEYSYEVARPLPPNVGHGFEVDPVTGGVVKDMFTAEAVVHYSKIGKPWAEHELAMAIWRWERQEKLREARRQR